MVDMINLNQKRNVDSREEERIIEAHELSSLRTKVAEMHKRLQEYDSQREAAEEANRRMHTTVQRLEGQVRRSEMRLATQDAAAG